MTFLFVNRRRLLRDHTLLIGRDDIDLHPGMLPADEQRVFFIFSLIQLDACKRHFLADPCPYGCRMLADPSREYQRIQAAQRRRIRANVFFY